ncbi:MAG TPA: hypothetical protein VKB49_09220 [Candidatus Sulfotelmatobacter sp.]|nr:hypothetical protein [Candidatus Sulfotelmatobacter sp.]
MFSDLVIRRPQASEYGSVQILIETVASETFKDIFAPNPVPLEFKDEDWPLAWVAVSDEKIVGVIITKEDWVGHSSGRKGFVRLKNAAFESFDVTLMQGRSGLGSSTGPLCFAAATSSDSKRSPSNFALSVVGFQLPTEDLPFVKTLAL